MLCAGLCFACGGILCKLVPWSGFAINGVRNILAAVVTGIYLLARQHKIKLNLTVVIGALSYTIVTTLFILANKLTTAANAIILQYIAPVWIVVMMALFFHVKPKKLDLITIAVIFVGIICFFFDSLSFGGLAGDICAIVSGMFYASLFIINKMKDSDQLSSIFLGEIISGLLFGWTGFKETDFSPAVLIAIFLLGVVQIGIAYIFFAEGTVRTPPVTASLIGVVEPILNPVLVAIFWGEVLKPLSLIGGIIAITSIAVYSVLQNRQIESETGRKLT